MRIKNKLYDYFVRKNGRVWYEYERYVREHIEEHKKHRLQHIVLLMKLNWFYRIRKGNRPYLYRDVPLQPRKESVPRSGGKERKYVFKNGAESAFKKREPAEVLAKRLLQYDVISFDIFDTLVFRPFSKPSDIFMLVGDKLGIVGFVKIRMDAEQLARKKNEIEKGNREVTLEEIYREISYRTNIQIEKGMEAEIEVEKEMIYANPYMKRVFDILVAQKKTVIATSDMYLNSEQLREILSRCGYEGFDSIIVSCEHNVSKSVGALYDFVKKQYSGKEIVHVGDNYQADYTKAKENDLTAIYYENVNVRGNQFRAEGMSSLVGDAYWGIVNSKLHSGLKQYTTYYEFGYVYAGIYILGYCNFIKKFVEARKIEKVLFLARDGEIYKKVFNLLYPEIATEYVYWSRIPAVKSTCESNRDRFLIHFIESKLVQPEKSRIGRILEVTDLAFLSQYLDEYCLDKNDYLIEENVKILSKMIVDHWDMVSDVYSKEIESYIEYLGIVNNGSKKVAIVDVGWMGNVVLTVKNLLRKCSNAPEDIQCLLVGLNAGDPREIESLELNEEIIPYIFSHSYNRNLYDTHRITPGYKPMNSFFFEMMTQSNSPTFVGFKDNQMVFDVPEVENYKKNIEVQRGIVDFALDYTEIFGNYKYMFNISGYDAYLPFRMMMKDVEYMKNNFGDFTFNRSTLETSDNPAVESVAMHLQHNRRKI